MAWYLLNLRQAKIASDRKARLHRINKDGNSFKLLNECNPGDQIRGEGNGLLLFERDSDREAFEYSREFVRKMLGNEYDVKKCDKCFK